MVSREQLIVRVGEEKEEAQCVEGGERSQKGKGEKKKNEDPLAVDAIVRRAISGGVTSVTCKRLIFEKFIREALSW